MALSYNWETSAAPYILASLSGSNSEDGIYKYNDNGTIRIGINATAIKTGVLQFGSSYYIDPFNTKNENTYVKLPGLTVTASGTQVSGNISADGGNIGKWNIGTVPSAYINTVNSAADSDFTDALYSTTFTSTNNSGVAGYTSIFRGSSSSTDWMLVNIRKDASNNYKEVFGIKHNGNVYIGNGKSLQIQSNDTETLTLDSDSVRFRNNNATDRVSSCTLNIDGLELAGSAYLKSKWMTSGMTTGYFTELRATRGYLTGTWTESSGSIISTSSRNSKYDIEPLPDRYSILFDNLKPVRFKYKNGESARYHTGFILDEVKDAIDIAQLQTSELAAYCVLDEASDIGGIRYQEFIALLTLEIQRLKQEIQSIKNQS